MSDFYQDRREGGHLPADRDFDQLVTKPLIVLTTSKIAKVSQEVCADCPQNYGGECRAFYIPHSEEEYLQRTSKRPSMNCQREVVHQ